MISENNIMMSENNDEQYYSSPHSLGKGAGVRLSIIDPNTLSAIGLKALLQEIMPIMHIDIFGSFAELQANNPEQYYHFFVSMNIVLENRQFFLEHRAKTIVLTLALDDAASMSNFHSLSVNVPENNLSALCSPSNNMPMHMAVIFLQSSRMLTRTCSPTARLRFCRLWLKDTLTKR